MSDELRRILLLLTLSGIILTNVSQGFMISDLKDDVQILIMAIDANNKTLVLHTDMIKAIRKGE